MSNTYLDEREKAYEKERRETAARYAASKPGVGRCRVCGGVQPLTELALGFCMICR